VRGSHYSV